MICRALGVILLVSLSACDSGPKKKTVVVYSAHGTDILRQFEKAFEAAHPDVDVQNVYAGSQELAEKIRSERKNPQAAVWWGSDSTSMDAAASDGALVPYTPSYSVPETMRHPENLWTGCFVIPILLGYHPDRIAAADLPRRFADLADPKYEKKIVLREPAASGTLRTFIGAMLSKSIKETGSDAAGFEYFKKLDKNVHHYEGTPELLFESLERGPASLSVWGLTDWIFQRTEKGYHFLPAGLHEPVPVIIDGIALVKGPGETAEARAYYEFVNSLDSLAILAKTHKRIPVRTDFDRANLVEEIRAIDFEPMKVDRALVNAKTAEWMRRFEADVRGR